MAIDENIDDINKEVKNNNSVNHKKSDAENNRLS